MVGSVPTIDLVALLLKVSEGCSEVGLTTGAAALGYFLPEILDFNLLDASGEKEIFYCLVAFAYPPSNFYFLAGG